MTTIKPTMVPPADDEPITKPTNNPGGLADELDADEAEFRALRRDLPGVKGVSGSGIVTISVSKIPGKNEFFRTHRDFRPIVPVVDIEIDMDRQFFAVTDEMVENLHAIGITVTNHVLYLTVTSRGAVRIVPVRQAVGDGEQNEYARTKEIGLVHGRMGTVVHRSGEPLLQGFPGASRALRRATIPGSEALENLQTRIPRQGPANRQHRTFAVQEVGGP